MATYGYIRVSTSDQNLESQKNLISRFCVEHKLTIDEWIALEMSSQKTMRQRKIEDLLARLNSNDVVISSELSRLGRSMRETLNIIESISVEKHARLILIKQNIDINPHEKHSMQTKVLIAVFSMVAELERDFISERTKEGLKARKARGISLGKPKGTIQGSMYDKDKKKIFHLSELGVPARIIIQTHLGYGKYLSLKKYIEKRKGRQEEILVS